MGTQSQISVNDSEKQNIIRHRSKKNDKSEDADLDDEATSFSSERSNTHSSASGINGIETSKMGDKSNNPPASDIIINKHEKQGLLRKQQERNRKAKSTSGE